MAKDTMKIIENAYEWNVKPITTSCCNKSELFQNDISTLNRHLSFTLAKCKWDDLVLN